MLDDVGSNLKTVKFLVQHFGCCMMLYSFDHVHATLLRKGMRVRSTSCNVKNVNALFIVEVHLAIKLVYRHPTFNNVKETIQS